ncbi:MAG: hypothetical protein J6C08_00550 [Campylobacter sp.]|uniref:hypothetical protein n=1 Tax=Campylobacter sp. TaxID=205 RepID=UPI000A359D27|nr:hypothetical protein [Campylobacter sp.]MBO5062989.1 hypothetical protein [Campylobacter sp.]
MKNLLLVLAFGFCLIGCSSKPSCSDEEAIRLVKEIVLDNGGLMELDLIHENGKVFGGVHNIARAKYTLEEFYAMDTSKFSKDHQQAFNRLKVKVNEFIKQKPTSIMTVNDSDDRVVQCRVQLVNDAEFVNFSAQYTDDGGLYVKVEL